MNAVARRALTLAAAAAIAATVTLLGAGAGAAQAAAPAAQAAKVAGLSKKQTRHAADIVDVGRDMGISRRGQIVAIATALQESNLRNLASTAIPESRRYPNDGLGSDHDSVGLFQQRPSTGWGKTKDLMKPRYAAKKFYGALKRVNGWERMSVTRAAQAVQISAFPDAYAKHETKATKIVNALSGGKAESLSSKDKGDKGKSTPLSFGGGLGGLPAPGAMAAAAVIAGLIMLRRR